MPIQHTSADRGRRRRRAGLLTAAVLGGALAAPAVPAVAAGPPRAGAHDVRVGDYLVWRSRVDVGVRTDRPRQAAAVAAHATGEAMEQVSPVHSGSSRVDDGYASVERTWTAQLSRDQVGPVLDGLRRRHPGWSVTASDVQTLSLVLRVPATVRRAVVGDLVDELTFVCNPRQVRHGHRVWQVNCVNDEAVPAQRDFGQMYRDLVRVSHLPRSSVRLTRGS